MLFGLLPPDVCSNFGSRVLFGVAPSSNTPLTPPPRLPRDHKGPVQSMMTEAAQAVRDLLHVPSDYHVLYLHGGAHAVFAALPLNLAGDHASADYVRGSG